MVVLYGLFSPSHSFFFKESFSYFSFDFSFGKGGEVGNGGFEGCRLRRKDVEMDNVMGEGRIRGRM